MLEILLRTIPEIGRSGLNQLYNLIFTVTCLFCYEPGEYICKSCQYKFLDRFLEPPTTELLKQVFICFTYNKALEYTLKQAKHEGYFEIATYIGELMAKHLLDSKGFMNLIVDNYTFVPVPLAKQKLRRRGFNQVELILKGMGKIFEKETGICIKTETILARTKDTKTQIGMNKQQRQQNLSKVFEISADFLAKAATIPQDIVLVDDVYTTGTTLSECAKVLKASGVKNIVGLTLAKG